MPLNHLSDELLTVDRYKNTAALHNNPQLF